MSRKNDLGVLGTRRTFLMVVLALVILTGCGLEQAQPGGNLLESSTPAQAQATSTATSTPIAFLYHHAVADCYGLLHAQPFPQRYRHTHSHDHADPQHYPHSNLCLPAGRGE
jgi:hypothetical protein